MDWNSGTQRCKNERGIARELTHKDTGNTSHTNVHILARTCATTYAAQEIPHQTTTHPHRRKTRRMWPYQARKCTHDGKRGSASYAGHMRRASGWGGCVGDMQHHRILSWFLEDPSAVLVQHLPEKCWSAGWCRPDGCWRGVWKLWRSGMYTGVMLWRNGGRTQEEGGSLEARRAQGANATRQQQSRQPHRCLVRCSDDDRASLHRCRAGLRVCCDLPGGIAREVRTPGTNCHNGSGCGSLSCKDLHLSGQPRLK